MTVERLPAWVVSSQAAAQVPACSIPGLPRPGEN